jgi:hypothetical protein
LFDQLVSLASGAEACVADVFVQSFWFHVDWGVAQEAVVRYLVVRQIKASGKITEKNSFTYRLALISCRFE